MRTSGKHPNYYLIENCQNTEKCPEDLKRLAVTQNPVKDHELILMWKNNPRVNNNNSTMN